MPFLLPRVQAMIDGIIHRVDTMDARQHESAMQKPILDEFA
jgi:hypothetical protein